jgi:hypothetical protein
MRGQHRASGDAPRLASRNAGLGNVLIMELDVAMIEILVTDNNRSR